MHRFFCQPLEMQLHAPGPRTTRLAEEEAHHARKVLRLKVGDAVELFDGRGGVGEGVIQAWDQGATIAVQQWTSVAPPRPVLTIAAAIPKGPRADDMVNQLSQLSVDRLIPLLAERSVVDPRPAKVERFARAAVESAKQCGRAWLMRVEPPTPFDRVLAGEYDVRLMARPGGGSTDLGTQLRAASSVLVLIGPEGGWSDAEIAQSERAGCLPWSLGPHVLRIETAACAAAAVIRYETLSQRAAAERPGEGGERERAG